MVDGDCPVEVEELSIDVVGAGRMEEEPGRELGPVVETGLLDVVTGAELVVTVPVGGAWLVVCVCVPLRLPSA